MRRKIGVAILAGLALGASLLLAETRINYFNGVGYVFPATQGAAGKVLTNDGSGNLSWASPATISELWTGAIIFSNSACPAGFTQLNATYNGRYFRASATGGGVGGSSSHGHTLTGSTDAQAVTLTGSSAGATISISGSTGTTSISHTHTLNPSYAGCSSGVYTSIYSISASATNPSHSHGVGTLSGGSHSHGVGTLAGSSHSHGVGTLAAGSTTITPPYYGVRACVKD
jgi:hypothetical protein